MVLMINMERFSQLFLMAFMFMMLISTAMAGKVTSPKNVPKNAILLSKVESLTLRAGKMTTSRRVSAVPQLSCVGPKNVCELYDVEVMRCTNEGADYDAENIQWACRADIPEEFKLGSTDVACEGYASSDDPYVLKGSCGVEYRLLLTEKGEQKFGLPNPHGDDDAWDNSTTSNLAKVVFFVIFLGVLFTIFKRIADAARRNPPRFGGGNGQPPWYGGGGGGGGNDDPPPPYDYHDNPSPPRKQRTYGSTSRAGTASSSRTAGGQQNQGWRPGPWTAGLAGAGLGYALGRNQNQTRDQQRPVTRPPSTGFFGGGGGSRVGDGSSSPPSFSSSRYESTGFGNTSRR